MTNNARQPLGCRQCAGAQGRGRPVLRQSGRQRDSCKGTGGQRAEDAESGHSPRTYSGDSLHPARSNAEFGEKFKFAVKRTSDNAVRVYGNSPHLTLTLR